MEQNLLALLELIAEQDGISIAKAAKKLNLAQSQLLRLLAVLADEASVIGFEIVEVRKEPARTMLHISTHGRTWLEAQK